MKYYAVKVGTKPGIYSDWSKCKDQVNGYKGAIYKSFSSLEEARVFMSSLSNESPIVPSSLNSIFVDGGHNRHTGINAWGSVVNSSGVDMIETYRDLLSDMELKYLSLPKGDRIIIISNFRRSSNDLPDQSQNLLSQQNNGAELLALVAGLRMALLPNSTIKYINSDSSCVLSWSIRLGESQRVNFDPLKVKFIDELILLRKRFEFLGGTIVKISGDKNLADLGYHK